MNYSSKIKPILSGVASMIVVSLIHQDDWDFTLSIVIAFVAGVFILPPLITLMSDNKKDTYYK